MFYLGETSVAMETQSLEADQLKKLLRNPFDQHDIANLYVLYGAFEFMQNIKNYFPNKWIF